MWFERLNRESAGRIAVGSGLTVEVLHWAYVPHLPDNILHRHTYFEVCLVGAWGSGQFRVKNGAAQTDHPIAPGSLFIARPGVLHQIVNDTNTPANMELSWISFHVPAPAGAKKPKEGDMVAARFAEFSSAADVLVVPAPDALSVAAIWNALRVTASTSQNATGELQTTPLTAALLLAIAQAGAKKAGSFVSPTLPVSATGQGGDRLVRQAVQYIHQHLSRPLPVGEIADYLAVSPRHLSRLLRAYTGVAPQEYVEQARLDRARTLLLRTDDPIKQVALLSGYADVAHFTRAFGRRFGCPPGAFRQTGGEADKTVRGDDMKTPGALV